MRNTNTSLLTDLRRIATGWSKARSPIRFLLACSAFSGTGSYCISIQKTAIWYFGSNLMNRWAGMTQRLFARLSGPLASAAP